MFLGKKDGVGETVPTCAPICDRVGHCVSMAVLLLLFGHQGWLLWLQSRMALVWLLAPLVPTWRSLQCGSKKGDDHTVAVPQDSCFERVEAERLPSSVRRARIGSLWQESCSWEHPSSQYRR